MSNEEETSQTKYLICKCFNILTINIGFLVIGIVLYVRKSTNYGLIIRDETTEWGQGPIVDILDVPSNGNCPSSYELVPVSFPGTQTICRRNSGSFFVGTCKRERFGHTEYGLPLEQLNIFNTVQICVKRQSNKLSLNRQTKSFSLIFRFLWFSKQHWKTIL